MAKSSLPKENIIDIDVAAEMQNSFLEYAYSVIYSRALPDARDGLKPVQRRILHTMANMGLRPEKGHVKSARVVGEVMGKLHPHGDSAIYDALVRMAQSWSLRLPFIDGHGNFGSLDEGPAAYRYTEARLAGGAIAMVESLNEDTVDFVANYDGRELEPTVLPSAIPSLLVNGASGIAVGMATNLPPHNLVEVINAATHLLNSPKATLDELMSFLPGPDLPTGGIIVGLDGVREAYQTGKGSFKMRATTSIEQISAKRAGIVVRELPYQVGPERVIERIKELVTAKKLQGIADVLDLTDFESGLELVIEIKNGFNPQAVLDQLFKLTPLEENFHINAVALVDGQPRTLSLPELLRVFLDHRLEVIRRRSEFRRNKDQERLHLVAGLLIAILDIDEVISVIRSSDDTAVARERLMQVFDLTVLQTNYILEMPLRRLTKFSTIELQNEASELERSIANLTDILENPKRLRKEVANELAAVAKAYGDERRTVLLDGEEAVAAATPLAAVSLEVADEPCMVLLSATGQIGRTIGAGPLGSGGKRVSHDTIRSVTTSTTRGQVGVITSKGRAIRLEVVGIPGLPLTTNAPTLASASALKDLIALAKDERPLAIFDLANENQTLFLATANGTVKRVAHDVPNTSSDWNLIRLEDDDQVVGASVVTDEKHRVVLIADDSSLLHFEVSALRAQGRPAGGVAGLKLAAGAQVIFGAVVDANEHTLVATVANSSGALPGTGASSIKLSSFDQFPAKGRATGGVRSHKFLKGEDALSVAVAGQGPIHACTANGAPVEVPSALAKRDASGTQLTKSITALAGSWSRAES
jgi:DNA gyrase subunit A